MRVRGVGVGVGVVVGVGVGEGVDVAFFQGKRANPERSTRNRSRGGEAGRWRVGGWVVVGELGGGRRQGAAHSERRPWTVSLAPPA